GRRMAELQARFDPRLLKLGDPHVTIAGSSGMGPIAPDTTVTELEERLAVVANETPPITLRFGRPTRFMQTEIVVLPLDPHGPLRALHERIKSSGLRASPPRFYFTPHVTLSLYREQPPHQLAALLAERFDEPAMVTRVQCHLTRDTGESRRLVEFMLGGYGEI
ncbi:MAG: 2'-5' RNA ligase family protein, partial [Gemmatimonadaceae bacterium]|nr:2'-5' RNA ligase family protein [Gemmatimonadaceae bacterium]